MDNLVIVMFAIGIFCLVFFVYAGLWWVVLWSFNYAVFFAWKQVLGIIALSIIMNSASIKYKKD